MKPKTPAVFDFRTSITSTIDVALTAKARARGVDKATVARDVLERWAYEEGQFAEAYMAERARIAEREVHILKRRKPISRRLSNAVFKRDGFRCKECGAEPGVEHLHIDHVLPVAVGGETVLDNLRVLCAPCNLRKSDKIVALPLEDDGTALNRKARR